MKSEENLHGKSIARSSSCSHPCSSCSSCSKLPSSSGAVQRSLPPTAHSCPVSPVAPASPGLWRDSKGYRHDEGEDGDNGNPKGNNKSENNSGGSNDRSDSFAFFDEAWLFESSSRLQRTLSLHALLPASTSRPSFTKSAAATAASADVVVEADLELFSSPPLGTPALFGRPSRSVSVTSEREAQLLHRHRSGSGRGRNGASNRCACGRKWDEQLAELRGLRHSRTTIGSENAPAFTIERQRQRRTGMTETADIEDMMTMRTEAEERELQVQLVDASPRLGVHLDDGATNSIEPIGRPSSKSPCSFEGGEGSAESSRRRIRRCIQCARTDCMLVAPRVGFFSTDKIAHHDTPDDCWISANGFVYDVTRYLSKHPGGAQSILKRAGGDASEDFNFHSKVARERIWRRYRIGQVAYCDGPKTDNCVLS